MAARALSEEQAREVIALIEECLKEGYNPPDAPAPGRAAITEAGKRFKGTSGAFTTRLRIARERYDLEPDWTLWRAPQYQHKKPSKSQPTGGMHDMPANIMDPEGPMVRVLAVGDTHDDPRLQNKERFEWIGRCAADLGVDRVVQVGDFGTWDSVSRHEDRSTITGRSLPTFEDDLASCRMALMALDRGLGDWRGQKHITLGNHEDRVKIYENLNPVHEGGMYHRMVEAFVQYGWDWRAYREYLFIQGVGFTHVPQNIMGRPYGGKTLNQIGNDAIFPLVFGHSHKGGHLPVAKIGPSCKIDIINLGCALPHGHVEDYAKLSTTGWQYGVYELHLQAGQIVNAPGRYISMLELRDKYSNDGADVAA